MTNLNFLVAAYSVFFLLLFGYTIRLAAKQREVDRRVEDLRRRLEARKGRD